MWPLGEHFFCSSHWLCLRCVRNEPHHLLCVRFCVSPPAQCKLEATREQRRLESVKEAQQNTTLNRGFQWCHQSTAWAQLDLIELSYLTSQYYTHNWFLTELLLRTSQLQPHAAPVRQAGRVNVVTRVSFIFFIDSSLVLCSPLTFFHTSQCHTLAYTSYFLSPPGPYAVRFSAVSPPGANPPPDDADGHPGSRGPTATNASDCPQPHPCFLHNTFLLPGTSTRYFS